MIFKQFCITFLFVNLLIVNALAQTKTGWVLPQHQLTALFGVGSTFDVPDHNRDVLSTVGSGFSYTYNFSKRWFLQASWQMMQGQFEMGEMVSTGNNWVFRPITASKEEPMLMPFVELKEKRTTSLSDIKNAPVVKLTSADGLYECNQFSLNFGYMKVMPRNVLRISLGVHQERTRTRALGTSVLVNNHTISKLNHLRVSELGNFGYNGSIAYDFFLTQRLSVGLYLNTSVQRDMIPFTFQSCLTVGYAPFKNYYKKSKAKPQA